MWNRKGGGIIYVANINVQELQWMAYLKPRSRIELTDKILIQNRMVSNESLKFGFIRIE